MPAGNSSSQALIIKQPSEEQIWFYLQRFLSFEEPLARYERIQDILGRHIIHSDNKKFKISELSTSQQEELFKEVFSSKPDLNSQAFNIALAFEDLRRFTPIAFQLWHSYYLDQNKNKSTHTQKQNKSPFAELPLSDSQKAWLDFSLTAVPNWNMIYKNGIWSSDARIKFIINCLESFSKSKIDFANVNEIEKQFQTILNKQRHQLPSGIFPQLIVLVEGPTEEILLPHFASKLNANFSDPSILIMPCRGSKQLLKKYLVLKEITQLNIVSILDHDALNEIELIKDVLRPNDHLHVWASGEIEDLFPLPVLLEYLNNFLNAQITTSPATQREIDKYGQERRMVMLDRLWQDRNMGKFDKIGFANFIKENPTDSPVPEEAQKLIQLIISLANNFKQA